MRAGVTLSKTVTHFTTVTHVTTVTHRTTVTDFTTVTAVMVVTVAQRGGRQQTTAHAIFVTARKEER